MTKINKLNFVSGILILFLSLFLIQCGLNVFPLSQDTQLGSEMDKEIRRNPQQYPILNNNYVQNYVQNLVNKILISPKIKYQDSPFQVLSGPLMHLEGGEHFKVSKTIVNLFKLSHRVH